MSTQIVQYLNEMSLIVTKLFRKLQEHAVFCHIAYKSSPSLAKILRNSEQQEH